MTQPEQENNQTTKIALGALAILAMAAALYWYFTSLRPETNLEEPSQVIVEPVAPNQPAEVTTNSGEVAPLPSLDETQAADLGTSESGVGVGTQLAGAPKEGINPAVPLAGVPNTNPFSPLNIEGEGENGNADMSASMPAGNGPSFNEPNFDAPSFNEPSFNERSFNERSAPVTTPRINSGAASGSSDWDFGGPEPVTLERPARANITNAAPGRTIDNDASSSKAGGSEAGGSETASWDFDAAPAGSSTAPTSTAPTTVAPMASAPTNNAGGYVSAGENGGNASWEESDPANGVDASVPGTPSGVVAGLPATATTLPQGFGGAANGGTGAGSNAGPAAAQPAELGHKSAQATPPDFVRQYGAASAAAPDDGTRLSRTLNARDYHFSGAVLGTTNTAIFKSTGGFDVVEEGKQLPNTDVIVREIDERRVVLALGDETVTLDLESLENF